VCSPHIPTRRHPGHPGVSSAPALSSSPPAAPRRDGLSPRTRPHPPPPPCSASLAAPPPLPPRSHCIQKNTVDGNDKREQTTNLFLWPMPLFLDIYFMGVGTVQYGG
jgi:hypothetical protein